MHIGINVSRLSGQRLGVGRYLEDLLKYWGRTLASVASDRRRVRGPLARAGRVYGVLMAFPVIGTALAWLFPELETRGVAGPLSSPLMPLRGPR